MTQKDIAAYYEQLTRGEKVVLRHSSVYVLVVRHILGSTDCCVLPEIPLFALCPPLLSGSWAVSSRLTAGERSLPNDSASSQ